MYFQRHGESALKKKNFKSFLEYELKVRVFCDGSCGSTWLPFEGIARIRLICWRVCVHKVLVLGRMCVYVCVHKRFACWRACTACVCVCVLGCVCRDGDENENICVVKDIF